MIKLEPVPVRRRGQAMRFLVGGARRDSLTAGGARAFEQLLRERGEDRVRLWWALRRRRCVAAALVFDSPGRTGMLSYSPPSAPGVEPEALAALVGAISRDALDRGLSLVQATIDRDAGDDAAMLRSAGYEKLAELLHMRLALARAPAAADEPPLTWRRYEQFSEDELAGVIAATYEGSQDCPLLRGVRAMLDVIAGHKATGVFRPQSWWIVQQHGAAAGCVVVNDTAMEDAFEVVYLGVVPAFRGRGIGRAMLRRAAAAARAEGRSALTLAVDARNHYAVSLYEKAGFEVLQRRVTYVMMRAGGPGEARHRRRK